MIHKKTRLLVLLFCFCLGLLPFEATALSTSDAIEPIIPEKQCSLSVSYCYGEQAFEGLAVRLYKIAEVSADFRYSLTPEFASSGLILNGIRTSGEWDVVRSTLEAYVLAQGIEPLALSETNAEGKVLFEQLETGMYFAVADEAIMEELHCRFVSALVALPGLEQDGRWSYDVEVHAKPEALPPIDPDETLEFRVLKLWRGDENGNTRPESIEVEIFRDGEHAETVFLSEETNWSYSWSAKDDGARWTVVERNIPEGYTMTLEEREASFVLTNTLTEDPGDPEDPPKTGDTSNVLVYILIASVSGTILIVVGIAGKRKYV